LAACRTRTAAGKLATIGFLFADAAIFTPWIAAFVERLNALGWIEGRTVAFEHRWSNGPARDAEIAAEFVRLPVDVILTDGPSVPIVKQATSTIPIVFALASDLVGVWSQVLRTRAATSPAYRCSQPILLASASNFCAKQSLISAAWR